jgi:hypothetical protein
VPAGLWPHAAAAERAAVDRLRARAAALAVPVPVAAPAEVAGAAAAVLAAALELRVWLGGLSGDAALPTAFLAAAPVRRECVCVCVTRLALLTSTREQSIADVMSAAAAVALSGAGPEAGPCCASG